MSSEICHCCRRGTTLHERVFQYINNQTFPLSTVQAEGLVQDAQDCGAKNGFIAALRNAYK